MITKQLDVKEHLLQFTPIGESKTPVKKKILVQRKQEIKLPQMANKALSENWLLKEIGDVHWELLSKGLESKSSGITNAAGDRLCAAFVRINYRTSQLNHYLENEVIDIQGSINRYGDSTYFSEITGYCADKTFKANLMSCFSLLSTGSNKQICKSVPVTAVNHINKLAKIPMLFCSYCSIKKATQQVVSNGMHSFYINDDIVDERSYEINHYQDINGVGLLYFAAYPIISDHCVNSYLREESNLQYSKYHTTYRDILYYANCDANDTVIHRLNNISITDNLVKTVVSMYRSSDMKMIAQILTVKEASPIPTHTTVWNKR
jgi:probable biosynthetic protein (TIGR04098 family)